MGKSSLFSLLTGGRERHVSYPGSDVLHAAADQLRDLLVDATEGLQVSFIDLLLLHPAGDHRGDDAQAAPV